MPDIANQQENLFNECLGMGCAAEPKKIQHLPEWDHLLDRAVLITFDCIYQSQPHRLGSNKTSSSLSTTWLKKARAKNPGFKVIERAETEVVSSCHRNTTLLESKHE